MPSKEEKHEVYVTELADELDQWISVTDASRVTRRQEHTIRSWIASGQLSVNPERTGINKKTRLVRLSDLRKLTPIIDLDAGVTTERGLLDLPSIPKEQQRLREDLTALQQEIAGQVENLTNKLAEFAQEMRPAWAAIRALQRRDEEQQKLIEQVLEQLTSSLNEVNQAVRQEIVRVSQSLDGRIVAQAQELVQARETLTNQIAQAEQALRLVVSEQIGQSEARLHQTVATLTGQLTEAERALRQEQAEAVEGLKSNVSALGTHLVESLQGEHNRTSEALQARQIAHDQLQTQSDERYTETHRQLTQLQGTQAEQDASTSRRLTELAGNATALDLRVAGQATQLSQLETTWQRRAETAEREARQLRADLDGQAKNQQALQKQLDEERKARETLAKQVEKLLQQSKKEKA